VSDWPQNPIAKMTVNSYHGGTSCSVSSNSTAAAQTVLDNNIDFRIDISFHDHPWFDNGRGYFAAQLERLTTNGWQSVAYATKTLGNDNDDGDWYDSLVLSVQMTDLVEQYRVVLHCETRDTSFGTSADGTINLQAVQGESAIGDFTLDFIPMSIVYCPPGQDMTSSLTQSESYGTRFTIGESSGMQSQTGVQAKVDVLGIVGEGVGFSQSQSTTNQATSGIQVSHFRTTVVTADNQKAIGRAYWGPLGDVFVILVNPSFSASRRADGTILYSLRAIEQVLAIPAWKLLRPDNDPIVSAVPADVRERLLELDPFITNLNLFFPDSGADLAKAANPFADPHAGNRAELIGRWWLDTGTELNYSLGDSQQLFSTNANEVSFSSTVSINASVGANFDGISAALGLSSSNTTSVGYQTSKETDAAVSTTASCFLMHNQNERDLDGIEIYYDKIFSTFMFRRVLARTRKGGLCGGLVMGSVFGADGQPLKQMTIQLRGANGVTQETATSHRGEYAFFNLCDGNYVLTAGDREIRVAVRNDTTPFNPVRLRVDGVRHVIDLSTAPVWEVVEALRLPTEVVQRISASLSDIRDVRVLARLAGVSTDELERWQRNYVLNWPKQPRPPRARAR
jgi:hypothetical protein